MARVFGIVAAIAAVAAGTIYLVTREDDGTPVDLPEPAGSAEVRETIADAVETRNSEDCTALATPKYLRQYERRKDFGSALAACRAGVFNRDRGLLQADVDVEVEAVARKSAYAFITYRGGPYGGIRARLVLLRKKGGQWKLNQITGYAFATRKQMNRVVRAEIASGHVPFGPRAANCAVRERAALPDPSLEFILIGRGGKTIYDPIVRCARAEVVEAAVREVRKQGLGSGAGPEECVRTIASTQSDDQLLALALDADRNGAADVAARCRAA